MNIICIYDVSSKKCIKLMKLLRKYLYHVQKSVFQGCLTPRQFKNLQNEIQAIADVEQDSVIFYFTYRDGELHTKEIGRKMPNRQICIDVNETSTESDFEEDFW